jgi:bifunctional UDP-N-acetylglucosamine pyrophosphorylase/glucosamine-1-phosphate N-acetyltransferase
MKPVVVFLAGGKSERFWPMSDKNLLPIMGKPLIQWQIENLLKLGFKDIIIVGNKNIGDWFSSFQLRQKLNLIKSGSVLGGNNKSAINIHFIRQLKDKAYSGMAGAILSAYELYQKHYIGKPIYILNANDFYENQLHEQILQAAQTGKADVFIATYRLAGNQPVGYLKVEEDRITDIIEKPKPGQEPSDLVNIVAHFYPKPDILFTTLKQQSSQKTPISDDLYEQVLAGLMKTWRFQPVIYMGEWQYLKYPWHLLNVMTFFLKKLESREGPCLGTGVEISPTATVTGQVLLEKGVRVKAGANILGPCWVGKNTIIGNNSLVRESHIGADCEIGFNTEVARSYVGDHCRLHRNYVGDSVLEKRIDFGAGAVTANFRLDEHTIRSSVKGKKIDTGRTKLGTIIGQESKVGVNASLMPGVKVSSHCVVGPNVVLSYDLPSGKICLMDQKISVTDNKYLNRKSDKNNQHQ